jgi:hypothetical protein
MSVTEEAQGVPQGHSKTSPNLLYIDIDFDLLLFGYISQDTLLNKSFNVYLQWSAI